MRNQRWDYVFLVAVAGLVFFSNLGGPKLWDRDEPRNAGCAREMLDRSDWVVPVFNAELRTHKPVLLYWLMMTAYRIFGVNEFSARFWSATLGVGTILLTYRVGSHLLGRQVGRLAGCVLATSLLFVVIARAATPDSALIFCSTFAIWLFVRSSFVPAQLSPACETPAGRRSCDSWRWPFPDSWGTAVGIYAAMGLGVLAKGPVGLVLPTAVIGMYCLLARLPGRASKPGRDEGTAWWVWSTMWTRPFWPAHFMRTCWAMRPFTAIATAICVAGPWYAWVGWRTGGAWLAGFFGEHNMGRALSAMEGHHGSFFFYPVALILCCLPWTVFTIPVIVEVAGRTRGDHVRRPAYVFLVCWLAVYVMLFSLAQTKLPSYVAPAFPAVAIMISAYAVAAKGRQSLAAAIWWRLGFATLVLIGVLTCAGLAWATARYVPQLRFAWGLGGVLLAAGVAGFWLVSRAADALALRVLVVGSVCFAVLTFGVLSARVGEQQHCDQLLAAAGEGGQSAALAAFGRLEPTWVFYAGRPIRCFRDDSVDEMVRYLQSEIRPMLLTTRRLLQRLPDKLKGQLVTVSSVPYFLKDDELLLCSLPPPQVVSQEWIEIHDFLAEGAPPPLTLVTKLQNIGPASRERLRALRDVLTQELDETCDPMLQGKLTVKIERLNALLDKVTDMSFVHEMSGLASWDKMLREMELTEGNTSRAGRCSPR